MVHVAERKDCEKRLSRRPLEYCSEKMHVIGWVGCRSGKYAYVIGSSTNPKVLSRNSVVILLDSRPCLTPEVNEDRGAPHFINCASSFLFPCVPFSFLSLPLRNKTLYQVMFCQKWKNVVWWSVTRGRTSGNFVALLCTWIRGVLIRYWIQHQYWITQWSVQWKMFLVFPNHIDCYKRWFSYSTHTHSSNILMHMASVHTCQHWVLKIREISHSGHRK